jgi:hypothetical protein
VPIRNASTALGYMRAHRYMSCLSAKGQLRLALQASKVTRCSCVTCWQGCTHTLFVQWESPCRLEDKDPGFSFLLQVRAVLSCMSPSHKQHKEPPVARAEGTLAAETKGKKVGREEVVDESQIPCRLHWKDSWSAPLRCTGCIMLVQLREPRLTNTVLIFNVCIVSVTIRYVLVCS